MRSCVGAIALLLLAGCMVLKTGPVSTDERPSERRESDLRIGCVDRVLKRVRPDDGKVSLTLEVVGDFDVGYEQRVEVVESVRGRTCVGLFPWTFAKRPGGTPGVDHLLSIVVNYGLAMTPTLYSWFFEPFSDYPACGVNDHVFAGFSILGAYRYCAQPDVKRKYARIDRTRSSKSVYRIEDFTVNHGGQTYRSKWGRVVLPLAYEVGMTVEAEIQSANVLSEELRRLLVSQEWQHKPWVAGGDRRPAEKQNKEPTRPKSSATEMLSPEFLVGKWESYQSHRTLTKARSSGRGLEQNQILHYMYEFFSDGTCRQTSEVSGKETVWSGQWQIIDGGVRMAMKNQDGSVCTMDYVTTVVSSNEIACRYADLSAYEKLFLHGNIKTAHARYNEADELVLNMGLETELKNGRKNRVTIDSTYSPLILERQEGNRE